MSEDNRQHNDVGGTQRGRTPGAARASWAPPVIGALSAAIVGSPLAGSALGTAFVAGLAALALGLLSRAGIDATFSRSSGGFGVLMATCIAVVALAAASILGTVFGATWVIGTAAIATFIIVTAGFWAAARRLRTATPRAS